MIQEVFTVLIVGATMAVDGGTESRFFLWLLLCLTWQALKFSMNDFRILIGFAGVAYGTVAIVVEGRMGTSIARFAIMAGFVFLLIAGRLILESYESRIHRLEQMLSAVIALPDAGMALYDTDRHTVMFSNQLGRDLGLATFDGMAHLIPDRPEVGSLHGFAAGSKIDTLASLVEDAGWLPYQPRIFRVIGNRTREIRIGVRALRFEDADPVILVYGQVVSGKVAARTPKREEAAS